MPQDVEQILATVDYSWPKDFIIRYLYINTASFFERDLSYFLATKEEQVEIYKKGFVNKGDIVVCSTLADFYVELFQSIGINAKKFIAIERKVPLFALMVEGDLGWYYLDPLKDLFNNQYGLKPTEFGVFLKHKNSTLSNYSELISLSKDYIDKIDECLGFSKVFLDDFFEALHIEITDKNKARQYLGENLSFEEMLFRKIRFMNEQLLNLGNVSGLYERLQLHQFLKNQIYNNSEKRFVSHRIVAEEDEFRLNFGITSPNNEELIIFEERNTDGVFTLERKK